MKTALSAKGLCILLVVAAWLLAFAPSAQAQGWISGSHNGSATPSGAAGGDLTGTYPNPTVATLTGTASTVTLVSNTTLSGAAGTGALSLGSMTGAATLPTGNLSWAGASTKTASLVSTGAGSSITITAGAASTWGSSVDNAVTIGTSTNRLVAVNSSTYSVWAASADANAAVTLSAATGGQVLLGLGAGNTLDVRLQRTASGVLTLDNNAGGSVTLRTPGAFTITSVSGDLRFATTIRPTIDATYNNGDSALRWLNMGSTIYNVFAAQNDANAVAVLSNSSGGQLLLGISSAGGIGVRIRSTGTTNNLILDDNAGGALLNVQLGGTASFGGGKGVFTFANANTNPTSNPTSAIIEYASGGGLFTRGSGGAISQVGAAGVGTINSQTMTAGFETYALRTTTGSAATWATIAVASSTCDQFIVQWVVRNTAASMSASDTTEVTCCNNGGTTCTAGSALIATPIGQGTPCPTSAPTVTGTQSGANAILQATCPGGSTVDWQFSLFTNTD